MPTRDINIGILYFSQRLRIVKQNFTQVKSSQVAFNKQVTIALVLQ